MVGGSRGGPTEAMVEEMTEEDISGGVESSSGFGDVFECQSEVLWFVCKMCLVHVDRFLDVPGTARIEDFRGWNHREVFAHLADGGLNFIRRRWVVFEELSKFIP